MKNTGYKLTKQENAIFIISLGISTIIISILFYDSILMTPIGILFYPKFKNIVEEILHKRKIKELRSQFCDFLIIISSSIATGSHMGESIIESRMQLIELHGKNSQIVKEVGHMINDMEIKLYTEVQALKEFSMRAGVEEIRQFVQVFIICRETGGNLEKAIRETADILVARAKTENEIEQIIAQKNFEGKIITFMPIIIILFLRVSSPEYIGIMYSSWAGKIIMTVSLLIIYMAYQMIEKITDIKI